MIINVVYDILIETLKHNSCLFSKYIIFIAHYIHSFIVYKHERSLCDKSGIIYIDEETSRVMYPTFNTYYHKQ